MRKLGEALKDDFVFEPHFGATLFKQGTELVALQRGNLETGIVAPQDISKQLPEWSILTAAYLFRDPDHLKKFFESDVGKEMTKTAEEKLGIHIIAPVYFGARQVNLKPDRKIETPADMAGIKLRMPGGDAWQFLGRALGANPTPMAYAEVYTGLQTGAIDGQDNPLPNDYNMKFYEVTSQIVLTSHLIAFDVFAVSKKTWDSLSPAQQQKLTKQVKKAIDWSTQQHFEREAKLVQFFKDQGLRSTSPMSKPSASMPRTSICSRTSPRTGRRACWTRSTRCEVLTSQRTAHGSYRRDVADSSIAAQRRTVPRLMPS